MRRLISLVLALCQLFTISILAKSDIHSPTAVTPQSDQITFVINEGQWPEKVEFQSKAGQAQLWFTLEGLTHQFIRPVGKMSEAVAPQDRNWESLAIRATFIGANEPTVSGVEELVTKNNYFIGNDPDAWRADIPSFARVNYCGLYDKIDVSYHSRDGHLEYDVIVQPGGDLSQVEISYDNCNSLIIDPEGRLIVATDWGEIIEELPLVYQSDGESPQAIAGRFVLRSSTSFGFELSEDYNPGLVAVIDPVIAYSSYLGGELIDGGWSVAFDKNGYGYYAVQSFSTIIPTLDSLLVGEPVSDPAFYLIKMSPDGQTILVLTVVEGTGTTVPTALVVDTNGQVYVAGWTWANDLPLVNEIQASPMGVPDAFVMRFDSDISTILFSTYLGGSSIEFGPVLHVTPDGGTVIATTTMSNNLPFVNAIQSTKSGPMGTYVAKIDPAGDSLIFGTFCGDANAGAKVSLASDQSGNILIGGGYSPANIPITDSLVPYDIDYHTGTWLVKLSGEDGSLMFGSRFPGMGYNAVQDILVEEDGTVNLFGKTQSLDFYISDTMPDWLTNYDASYENQGKFFMRLDPDLTEVLMSTVTPMSPVALELHDAAFLSETTILIAGTSADRTGSTSIRVSLGLLDLGGGTPSYAEIYNRGGFGLPEDMAIDMDGNVGITGNVDDSSLVTASAIQPGPGGGTDAFIAKLLNVSCCGFFVGGYPGNTNCDTEGSRNLADITVLIDRVFLSKTPLCCESNGDIDHNDKRNLADITRLIDLVYLSKVELDPCS